MYFCDESEVWKLTGPKAEQRQVCDTLRLTFFFMDLGEWLFVPSKVKQVMETNAHIEGPFHFLLTQSHHGWLWILVLVLLDWEGEPERHLDKETNINCGHYRLKV